MAPPTAAAHARIRREVAFVEGDRYYHPDISRLESLVNRGAVVKAIEIETGIRLQ